MGDIPKEMTHPRLLPGLHTYTCVYTQNKAKQANSTTDKSHCSPGASSIGLEDGVSGVLGQLVICADEQAWEYQAGLRKNKELQLIRKVRLITGRLLSRTLKGGWWVTMASVLSLS